jgi:hypothetical protein
MDGSYQFLPGVMNARHGRAAQLPDQNFLVFDYKSDGTIYAANKSDAFLNNNGPLMAFQPRAPDSRGN